MLLNHIWNHDLKALGEIKKQHNLLTGIYTSCYVKNLKRREG